VTERTGKKKAGAPFTIGSRMKAGLLSGEKTGTPEAGNGGKKGAKKTLNEKLTRKAP